MDLRGSRPASTPGFCQIDDLTYHPISLGSADQAPRIPYHGRVVETERHTLHLRDDVHRGNAAACALLTIDDEILDILAPFYLPATLVRRRSAKYAVTTTLLGGSYQGSAPHLAPGEPWPECPRCHVPETFA